MRAGTHSRFLSSLHTGVLAFLLALAPGSGHAQSAPPPSRGGISVIDIRGPITTEHRTKLRRALEASDPDRYPAGAILLLDSPGGKPACIWQLTDARAVRWTGPDLNAMVHEIAMEELELIYETITWRSGI